MDMIRVGRARLYLAAGWTFVGVCVLDNWVCVQPFPCIGVAWRRRAPTSSSP